jgi:hypothetical protein
MLVTNTIFVSSENREIRRLRKTSTIKTQPKPPSIIKKVMVMSNIGLEENLATLLPPGISGRILNPALFTEDTERNIECQRARTVCHSSTS